MRTPAFIESSGVPDAKRAEQVDQTRQRIVEPRSTCGTVGPAATTIAGIAEQAGVTRLTVYRHFPDEVALYLACTSHWMAQQVPPDPDAWAKLADPADRLHAGLADLYRYYRQGQAMLTRTYRDLAALPESLQRAAEGIDRHYRDVLLEPLPAPAPGPAAAPSCRARSAWCRSGPGDRCASKAGCRTARPSRPWPPWPGHRNRTSTDTPP